MAAASRAAPLPEGAKLLPPVESPQLAQLRKLVEAKQMAIDDEEAERFLAARGDSPAKAAKLYAAYLAWRRQEAIEGILNEAPLLPPEREAALVRNFNPIVLDGCDLHGRPVVFARVGRIDVDDLSRNGVSMTIASRRHIRALERVRQRLSHARAAEGARRVKPGYLFILDVKDGGAGSFLGAWKLWVIVAKCDSKLYPNLVGSTVVINAPTVADWCLGVVKKTLIDGPTAEKITLDIKDDPEPCLRTMLPPELIAQLPAELFPAPVTTMSDEIAE